MFAFGLLVLAFGCAALYLAQHRMLKRKRLAGGLFGKLPPLASLDHLAFALVAFAFPLLTVGLAAGIVEALAGGLRGHWGADPMVLDFRRDLAGLRRLSGPARSGPVARPAGQLSVARRPAAPPSSTYFSADDGAHRFG